MAKITLDSVASGYDLSKINSNFVTIAAALNDEVLYRDNPVGETNTLLTGVDVNSQSLYNIPTPTLAHAAANKAYVDSIEAGAAASAAASAVSAAEAAQSALDATSNGAAQVALAAAQVVLAADQVNLAAVQVGLATTQAGDAADSAADALASENNAETAETNAAASAVLASQYSSLGLGGAAGFDFGSVADPFVIFPTDWGTIV